MAEEGEEVTWSIGAIEPLPVDGQPPPPPSDRAPWRATLLASVAALAVALLALVLTVSSKGDHGLSCPEAWREFDAASLPAGWEVTNSEYNVVGASFTLEGPNPGPETPTTPAFSPLLQVSVYCAGPGTEKLFDIQRATRPSGTAAPAEVDIGQVGDRRLALGGGDQGTLEVEILRGPLIAQFYVTGEDLDHPDLRAIYRAVDEFMKAQ